ncbi:MAG TPA: hypothetical protein VKY19_28960 [Ktedonosporobacter sp.]|nr:hypothetical protein [Ktedonosporobacter sp.]
MNIRQTDEFVSRLDLPPEEPEPLTRFIDIHVYEGPAVPREIPIVESQQDDQEPAATIESEQDQPKSARPRWYRRYIIPLLVLACPALLSIMLVALLSPLLTGPVATVTIVPVSKQITTTSTITVTTGQGQPTRPPIIPGRELAAITMSQAVTAPTTGTAHQDAQAARGAITFYNAAPVEQTVNAGTLLTGADGIQIVTEQDAIIPAATPPTEGQATVSAHAVVTGPAGNIVARDVYGPCCRLNVFAVSGPFHGGENARSYHTVAEQDITSVTSSLKVSLDQSVQAALQTQVQSDETLITPLPCQQSVTADHHPGEEATQVHVTVSETCTGAVYQTQAYQNAITQIETQQATTQLGNGYLLANAVQSSIVQATVNDHQQIALVVKIAGTWVYQFPQDEQQRITALIAGEGKAQAMSLLEHVPGVQAVSLTIKNGAATLPTDTNKIHLVVLITG